MKMGGRYESGARYEDIGEIGRGVRKNEEKK